MTFRYSDFQQFVALEVLIHNAKGAAAINSELGAIATALSSDTRTHDATIQAPPAALAIGPANTRFTNDVLCHVNAGLAGNLTQSQMIAAIDGVAGVLAPPANVDVPYASANASPPIVGTVASVTNGNWVGTPSSYTYAWTRDGTPIGGATAATYTLVSADVGGHQLRCVVTATNATGSTAAPPSNMIQT